VISRQRRLLLWVATISLSWSLNGPTLYAAESLKNVKPVILIPSTANEDVIIVTGTLENVGGVDHFDLSLNDAVLYTFKPESRESVIPIRVAIKLRPGNNLFTIEAIDSRGNSRRWQHYIFRPPNSDKFALLIQGAVNSQNNYKEQFTQFRSLLNQRGIPSNHIWTITPEDTRSDLATNLAEISSKSRAGAQVLIYYVGEVIFDQPEGDILLQFRSEVSKNSKSGGLPVRDFLHAIVDATFPSVAIVFDVDAYDPNGSVADAIRSKVSAYQTSTNVTPNLVSWLRILEPQTNAELAISTLNFSDHPNDISTGTLTNAMINTLKDPSIMRSSCPTLAALVKGMQTEPAEKLSKPLFHPYYFTTAGPNIGFCFGDAFSISPLSTFLSALLGVASVAADIPPVSSGFWIDISVDGVIVEHRSTVTPGKIAKGNRVSRSFPISPGEHVISLREGSGSELSFAKTTLSGFVANPIVTTGSPDTLSAAFIQPATPDTITTKTDATLDFVVGDRKAKLIRYEVRNNGVVIISGFGQHKRSNDKLEYVRNIPLSIGVNNLVINVRRNGFYKEVKTAIVRRPADQIRAIIVGIDTYKSKKLPSLKAGVADAELFMSTLLRYTDATPSRITILTDGAATAQAIRDFFRVANSSVSTALSEGGEETLLLYFSGYGTTLPGNAGGSDTRCILPYEADLDDLTNTCLSTAELDQLLGSRQRAIAFIDTSYDGPAGYSSSQRDDTSLFSRTFGDYFSRDPGWRLTSGIDRNDHTFLVASETNLPALESASLQHGLFTYSFVRGIESVLSNREVSTPGQAKSLSLIDAYTMAQGETVGLSGMRQKPIMKGSLSRPFSFSELTDSDLRQEARAVLNSIRQSSHSLREVNAADVDRAADLTSKLSKLKPNDAGMQLILSESLLYDGKLLEAEQLISSAMDSISSNTDDPSREVLYEGLLLRSQLRTREGNLEGAIADCVSARELTPDSNRATYQLGELFASTLQYEKSAEMYGHLLGHMRESSKNPADSLTDEEWGKVLIWRYIDLQRLRRGSGSSHILRVYANTGTILGKSLKALYANKVTKKMFGGLGRNAKQGNIALQATWTELIARYMLNGKASALMSYRGPNQDRDTRDEKSFDCALHFYLGMYALLHGRHDISKSEFEAVLATGQKQYAEYWFAKTQLATGNL
jgi:uncharacterized caspase-like protein